MGSLGNQRSIFIFKMQPCIGFLCPFRILLLLFPFLHEKRSTIAGVQGLKETDKRKTGLMVIIFSNDGDDDDDASFSGLLV